MKRILITLLTISISYYSLAQSAGNSQEIALNSKAKYPYSHAMITYEVSGDASGKTALHFDREGWRSVFHRELTFKRYGITSTEKSMELTDGDYIYSVNLDAKKGRKSLDKNWSSLIQYKSNSEVVSAIMESEGATLDRIDTLLGKTCRVWTFEQSTTKSLWEHEGIPLKIKKQLPGYSYTIQATAIDTSYVPEESQFTLPDSINWQSD